MTEHVEYPLTMAHPAFQRSQPLPIPGTEKRNAEGVVISQDYQGTPERFPPVTVQDADQEAYYESQGYARAGHSDPSAYASAHAAPAPPSYVPQEYPKWVNGVLYEAAEDVPVDKLDDGVIRTAETMQQAAAPPLDYSSMVQMTAADIAPVEPPKARRKVAA